MTRLICLLLYLNFTTQVLAQKKEWFIDTTTIAGQLLQTLKVQGVSGLTLTNKRTGQKYQGYRFCEHQYLQVDSLNQLLRDTQIDTLLSCNNGTIKITAFILFSKRNNDKIRVIDKLKELLKQEYIVMTSSCSDAITTSSFGHFPYDLLTKSNFFYKPNFKLTKQDKALIKLDLAYYELPFSSKPQ